MWRATTHFLKRVKVRLQSSRVDPQQVEGSLARETNKPLVEGILDEYESAMPSAQNSIDLIGGWNTALPPRAGVIAGRHVMYNDPRILWAIQSFGSLTGMRILELGPLEGSHTFMLHRQAPELIHAIEANKKSFLRCVIVKNLLRLNRAQFLLGDFEKWLEAPPLRYDFIVASGVLYHMRNPVRLLELISQCSDAVYIWSHYFSEEAMPPADPRRTAFSGRVSTVSFNGMEIRLHERSYHEAWLDQAFCGGMQDLHYWMEKEQIVSILRSLGFDQIELAHDVPTHKNGPCVSLFARRSISSGPMA